MFIWAGFNDGAQLFILSKFALINVWVSIVRKPLLATVSFTFDLDEGDYFVLGGDSDFLEGVCNFTTQPAWSCS